jgi:hypothetical protein
MNSRPASSGGGAVPRNQYVLQKEHTAEHETTEHDRDNLLRDGFRYSPALMMLFEVLRSLVFMKMGHEQLHANVSCDEHAERRRKSQGELQLLFDSKSATNAQHITIDISNLAEQRSVARV